MSTGNVKWIRRVYAIKSVIYKSPSCAERTQGDHGAEFRLPRTLNRVRSAHAGDLYVLSTFTFLISLFLFPAFKGLNLEDFSPG